MIELNDENFNAEIKEGKVVVDCYAPWCGNCKMIAPKVEELAKKLPGYKFYAVDVDKCPKIAEALQIMNLPTLLVFENGTEVKRGVFDILIHLEAECK